MKKLGLIHALLLFSTLLTAQSVRRVNCLVGSDVETVKPLVATAGLFSSEDIYRQLVILVSFADCDFLPDDSLEYYQRMFNEVGFVQRKGAGSVADYFRVQSNGRLNLAFDVYDLCGKRMANASQLLPGIYIVNGKKRIISRR